MKPYRPIPHAPFDKEHPLCDVVAEFFLEMREGYDVSRLDLAVETNISDEGIRLIETCTCIPRLDRAIRFSEGLGLPLSETLREAEARLRGKQGVEGSVVALGPTEVTLSVDATGGAGSFTGWNLSLAGARGAPGEVTNAAMDSAIASAIEGTSNNTNAVPTLDTPLADPDMEELRQKINEMLLAQRR